MNNITTVEVIEILEAFGSNLIEYFVYYQVSWIKSVSSCLLNTLLEFQVFCYNKYVNNTLPKCYYYKNILNAQKYL